MAMVPVCYKLPCKDGGSPVHPVVRQYTIGCLPHAYRGLFGCTSTKWVWKRKGDGFSIVCCDSQRGTKEKQLTLLDSSLGNQHDDDDSNKYSSDFQGKGKVQKSCQFGTKEELESLNAYIDKIKQGNPPGMRYNVETIKPGQKKQKGSLELRNEGSTSASWMAQSLQRSDNTPYFYLVGILASINIAVFLFEIATPVRRSEFQLFSLPLLYGAKINDLILTGEWWRLVTPMFLHSGVLHIALGCWSLLTFGPEVCRRYGSFTFLLIYILGGFACNLTSFLHTPDPAVGGTGPIFAIMGAWLVHENQNKDGTGNKDASDDLFQKAMMTTAVSFILSHFGPIDDWAHLGSVMTGIAYGFFTCTTLQLDHTSSGSGKDEGFAVVGRRPDLCKSLMLFAIFVVFLGSLLFVVEPPLGTLVTEEDINLGL